VNEPFGRLCAGERAEIQEIEAREAREQALAQFPGL
jgi:hypothetical protein